MRATKTGFPAQFCAAISLELAGFIWARLEPHQPTSGITRSTGDSLESFTVAKSRALRPLLARKHGAMLDLPRIPGRRRRGGARDMRPPLPRRVFGTDGRRRRHRHNPTRLAHGVSELPHSLARGSSNACRRVFHRRPRQRIMGPQVVPSRCGWRDQQRPRVSDYLGRRR